MGSLYMPKAFPCCRGGNPPRQRHSSRRRQMEGGTARKAGIPWFSRARRTSAPAQTQFLPLPERLFGVHDLYGALQALDREVVKRKRRLLCLGFQARAQMRRDCELISRSRLLQAQELDWELHP